VSSKLDLKLERGQRADAAATVVLHRLIQVIRDNEPGTLADIDTEFLHDYRVAVRRTRSLQRQFKRVFAPEPLAHFREAFKGLQQITGDTRDLDVYLLDFDGFQRSLPYEIQGDLEPLRSVLELRRKRAFALMSRHLRASTALDEWEAFVTGLVTAPEDERPDAGKPVEEVAAKRIGAVYRTMIKEGSVIDDASPHEALHDLRKVGKELRYLLEFFASLFDPDVVKPLVKSLKALQDVLGTFQDREVQAAELRDLRDDVAKAENGAAALMAMGLLVDRLAREQHEARAHFAEQFEAFRAQRKIVKANFG
jgi:CHAD domain-containing protein